MRFNLSPEVGQDIFNGSASRLTQTAVRKHGQVFTEGAQLFQVAHLALTL